MNEAMPRILIVDDNAEIHEDFKKILLLAKSVKTDAIKDLERDLFGDAGACDASVVAPFYEISDAYQGEEAVEMVDQAQTEGRPFSLIFMDVRMPPGIDGIETIQRIWKKHPHAEIVVCTAYSDYSWDQMLQKIGVTDHLLFIKKPFDGVGVKQIALAMTTKWRVAQINRENVKNLEYEVEKRTLELHTMMKNLSSLKDQAEAATKAKTEFLSNMSHEIRTPMNAVIGFGELLKNTKLDNMQKDCVETICTSGELLLALINDILDISKIESKKITLEEINFDVHGLIENVLKLLRQQALAKGKLDLNLDYPHNVPRFVIGDPTRMRQILINLVGNAIKFTDKGNVTISVQHNRTEIDDLSEMVRLEISIKDTGIGIPKAKQSDIFEAFTQVDSSTTRRFGGSGLGLTITQSLVRLMGGAIVVQSDVDKGSNFIVTLAFKKGQSAEESDSPLVKKLLEPEMLPADFIVLIVEDNPLNQKLMGIIFKQMGCRADMAGNGREAVEMASKKSYSVILMDIQMPVMDGYKATEHIREDLKLTTPIIALSAKVFEEDKEKCLQSGMDDFLPKPVEKNALWEMIQKWGKKSGSIPH